MFAVTIFALLLTTTDVVYSTVVDEIETHRSMDNYTGPVNGYRYPAYDDNKSKEELYQLVANGEYDNAVSLIKTMDTAHSYGLISETVQKLLDSHSTAKTKAMSFAYKLWSSGEKDIVQRHFPRTFKNILNQDYVKIVNKKYGQALKLDANKVARGDSHDLTSNRVSWKFIPVWKENALTFKIYNIYRSMYLKLAVATDDAGERKAYGSTISSTDRRKFYLEPHIEDGDLVFYIINVNYDQGLKLNAASDNKGDRRLMSHNGDIYANTNRFKWTISPW